MYETLYLRASSLDEALAWLREHADARPLSGGMTLIPTLKQRLAAPSHLIDLTRIEAMRGISVQGDVLHVGALTRHAEVAASPVVEAAIPALARLANVIADPQVRNRGTMGGSVANNDPAADYPSAVLALGAQVVTSQRRIAADDYFVDTFQTALEPDELVIGFEYPIPLRAAYAKLRQPASSYAVVGVFVAQFADSIRVAVTGTGASVFRWFDAEAALHADLSEAALACLKMDSGSLPDDDNGSAAYRAHLIETYTRRAVQALLGQPLRRPA
ncbi:xanthine dehydrogenase family protein subunit M [bacterium M00.F.Ca.ET.228.01.1.1]|uniref:FAD binding domain-containing protein n=1 Tax=Paraburkholderia phenoliruptrix TaxID=252970 RepID=UPI00109321DC|nr:xanthine dehydrogenase family protein subunit M [Paraburkholderia phenoliruptrix]TGP41400.1 xanthine dehydrogenase family protein subunit M [bacterium M00.F.Ca.ET.228.01.1.1]TGR98057.1 xanthine dehydrogenase family protein subunit M [bacterium M00.F.Ca.ET.191.01.1.1]TGU02247.1 xanthine dehydrogenase family protein subunit M [bacterium M00.F.Ca.ET.155.01.1.1]MBW0447037.1 xanthine dehydrogenase family protein subunit M [Paraburkholderia phenoliruptrix]MBW9101107.1 xanthine dehydrogenase famil